ncbi:MAG TPA: hypothetical protein VE288_02945 [Rubrobacteraceae bacterium]|nr:hypothetical protein [Rubrobacteraceae bacterium]
MRRIKAILAIGAAVGTMVTMSAPVMAQDFGQEFRERRITSGAANPTTTIRNTGDNVNLCTPVQQVSNTGNVANEQGFVPVGNGFIDNGFIDNGFINNGFIDNGFIDNGFLFPVDNFGFGGDVDFEGSNITIEPSATATCDQTLNQAAAA